MASKDLTVKTVWAKHFVDSGNPTADDFEIVETELKNEVGEGNFLIQIQVMSVDPYLRGTLKSKNGSEGRKVMTGFVAGKVLQSKNSDWKQGDFFGAALPFSTFQLITPMHLEKTSFWKLTGMVDETTLSRGIGALGMPGSTAYGGFIDILKPNEGETLFVSAASGAVGNLVGQLAKFFGVKTVIGSCGGPEKCKLIKEKFGYDAAIDYKTVKSAKELEAKLREVDGEGIDMYFENVGGMHFDAAFSCLKTKGRIAICGTISNYNDAQAPKNEIDISSMIYTAQRIEGFVCMPWLTGAKGNFLKDMSGWINEGKVKVEETFVDGVEQWPNAFCSLFTSGSSHTGKLVVRV
eukprot:CAMPEP_0204841462 /NCGR_PEP_ID=MMETSP1346-20131115/42149_1 /ASSEMBLY_ACC=CAM_ASM_000771 /TAXON_ID=215587 /ORGANISM="Aplanochytrium stocchinoi, Strain GSBS06" /LENGTH=349 /DNA_ID=CAMNT_0051979625 /DNA_START=81 /DNA_END=1130 /DNA_ORIENTATION=-